MPAAARSRLGFLDCRRSSTVLRAASVAVGAILVLEVLGITGSLPIASHPSGTARLTSAGNNSSITLPPASSLTREPGDWLAGLNITPWQSEARPIVNFVGATWCPYCAASSWVVYKVFASLGGISNVTLGYSSSTDVDPSTPEVVIANATVNSTSVALLVSEDTSGVDGRFPTITDPVEEAYFSNYAGESNPFAVVNGQFIHGEATLVDPDELSAYENGSNGGAAAVEASVLSESGTPWTVVAPQVYLVLAFVIESLGVSVTTLATEYDWSTGLTAGVQAAVKSLTIPAYSDTPLATLFGVYTGRPDLQAAFPNATTGNLTSLAGLVSWASEVANGKFPDSAFDQLGAVDVGYYYTLLGVYNNRPDLRSAFPNAYTNLNSYGDLLWWAGQVVTGRFTDESIATLSSWDYAYDLFGVYESRPDLQAAFANATGNLSDTFQLMNWAGGVASGAFPDSANSTLQEYGPWYVLLLTYDGRSDLQAAFPDAFGNVTEFHLLVNWAGNVATSQFSDSAKSVLFPWGYVYDLMNVYDGRTDLQAAYPNAWLNVTNYTLLVNWAGGVVTQGFPDTGNATLEPFGYYYDLMMVYDGRSDLQAAYPNAFTNSTSYANLLAWAKDVVEKVFPDTAYTDLEYYATYYETYG